MEIEKLAHKIFEECAKDNEPVTMDEAMEMAKMELGAKENRRYEKADKPVKVAKPRPLNEIKVQLIKKIFEKLNFDKMEIKNPQREITFNIGEVNYSLTLTEHRPKKIK